MKIFRLFLILFFISYFIFFSGCLDFEEQYPLGNVKIYLDDKEQGSFVTVQKGQTITLKAEAEYSKGEATIIWEITGNDAIITSSGVGETCTIRGENINTTGSLSITARAWRPATERLRSKTISLFVSASPVATGIDSIKGQSQIIVGEEQMLSAVLIPAWADSVITWSQHPANLLDLTPIPNSNNVMVKGTAPGETTITAATEGFSKTFNIQITESISGNPVTGIRIMYTDAEAQGRKLPVQNIIWLYPGETVDLEAQTTGGSPDAISWTINNSEEVQFSGTGTNHTGANVSLTGGQVSNFYNIPTIIHITAHNSDNKNPVSTFLHVKTQSKPLWAWDRARDGHLNMDITPANPPTSELPAATPRPTLSSFESATNYKMRGRGLYSEVYPEGIPVKVKANFIPYTVSGLLLNSSNNFSGDNPDPVAFPKYGSATSANSFNSTRIMIGSNIHTDTASDVIRRGQSNCSSCLQTIPCPTHKEGTFNFLEITNNIRISVDYEIIWSASPSRDMWILVNNNNANATQARMGTNSQILIEPLIAPRGTRATAVTYLDTQDIVNRNVNGYEDLANAFITIVVLSNGGSIYVSGIRIETEE